MSETDYQIQQKEKVAQMMFATLKNKHRFLKERQQEMEEEEEEKMKLLDRQTPWKDPKAVVTLNKQTGKYIPIPTHQPQNSNSQQDLQSTSHKKINSLDSNNSQINSHRSDKQNNNNYNNNNQYYQQSSFNNNFGQNAQPQNPQAAETQRLVQSIAKHFGNIVQGFTRNIGQQVAQNINSQLQQQNDLIKQIDRTQQFYEKKRQYMNEKQANFIRVNNKYDDKKEEIYKNNPEKLDRYQKNKEEIQKQKLQQQRLLEQQQMQQQKYYENENDLSFENELDMKIHETTPKHVQEQYKSQLYQKHQQKKQIQQLQQSQNTLASQKPSARSVKTTNREHNYKTASEDNITPRNVQNDKAPSAAQGINFNQMQQQSQQNRQQSKQSDKSFYPRSQRESRQDHEGEQFKESHVYQEASKYSPKEQSQISSNNQQQKSVLGNSKSKKQQYITNQTHSSDQDFLDDFKPGIVKKNSQNSQPSQNSQQQLGERQNQYQYTFQKQSEDKSIEIKSKSEDKEKSGYGSLDFEDVDEDKNKNYFDTNNNNTNLNNQHNNNTDFSDNSKSKGNKFDKYDDDFFDEDDIQLESYNPQIYNNSSGVSGNAFGTFGQGNKGNQKKEDIYKNNNSNLMRRVDDYTEKQDQKKVEVKKQEADENSFEVVDDDDDLDLDDYNPSGFYKPQGNVQKQEQKIHKSSEKSGNEYEDDFEDEYENEEFEDEDDDHGKSRSNNKSGGFDDVDIDEFL